MIILSKKIPSKQADIVQIVCIFGVGIIGSSIYKYLLGKDTFEQNILPFSWTKIHLHKYQLQNIENRLLQKVENADTDYKVKKQNIFFDILWSAGKCDFYSSEKETFEEFTCFKKILSFMTNIKFIQSNIDLTVHLISSAGGIFEGSAQKQLENKPSPIRPYGFLKLKQEKFVLNLPSHIKKKIFRLSSVYGYIDVKKRMGLIPTLIYNGLTHRVSSIVGDVSTLRDYIFCMNIGNFIGNNIIDHDQEPEKLFLLASGKPSSIGEVQKEVQDTIGRKIYIKYLNFKNNRRDICFNKNQIPKNLQLTDIRTGVRRIYSNWIKEGGAN